jgi:hypothetical protein
MCGLYDYECLYPAAFGMGREGKEREGGSSEFKTWILYIAAMNEKKALETWSLWAVYTGLCEDGVPCVLLLAMEVGCGRLRGLIESGCASFLIGSIRPAFHTLPNTPPLSTSRTDA